MTADRSEARRRSWETRRERYGAKGHGAAYRKVGRCPGCERLQAENDELRQRLAQSVSRETVKDEEGRHRAGNGSDPPTPRRREWIEPARWLSCLSGNCVQNLRRGGGAAAHGESGGPESTARGCGMCGMILTLSGMLARRYAWKRAFPNYVRLES